MTEEIVAPIKPTYQLAPTTENPVILDRVRSRLEFEFAQMRGNWDTFTQRVYARGNPLERRVLKTYPEEIYEGSLMRQIKLQKVLERRQVDVLNAVYEGALDACKTNKAGASEPDHSARARYAKLYIETTRGVNAPEDPALRTATALDQLIEELPMLAQQMVQRGLGSHVKDAEFVVGTGGGVRGNPDEPTVDREIRDSAPPAERVTVQEEGGD